MNILPVPNHGGSACISGLVLLHGWSVGVHGGVESVCGCGCCCRVGGVRCCLWEVFGAVGVGGAWMMPVCDPWRWSDLGTVPRWSGGGVIGLVLAAGGWWLVGSGSGLRCFHLGREFGSGTTGFWGRVLGSGFWDDDQLSGWAWAGVTHHATSGLLRAAEGEPWFGGLWMGAWRACGRCMVGLFWCC